MYALVITFFFTESPFFFLKDSLKPDVNQTVCLGNVKRCVFKIKKKIKKKTEQPEYVILEEKKKKKQEFFFSST